MKGNFFIDGMEWKIIIDGESFYQDQKMSGSFSLINHKANTEKVESPLTLLFAGASFKDVRAKNQKPLILSIHYA